MGDFGSTHDGGHWNFQLKKEHPGAPYDICRSVDVFWSDVRIGTRCHDYRVLCERIDCYQCYSGGFVGVKDARDIQAA